MNTVPHPYLTRFRQLASGNQKVLEELIYTFTERAGIREYDGRIPRAEAEELAYLDTIRIYHEQLKEVNHV